jgi:hypothetical protein
VVADAETREAGMSLLARWRVLAGPCDGADEHVVANALHLPHAAFAEHFELHGTGVHGGSLSLHSPD